MLYVDRQAAGSLLMMTIELKAGYRLKNCLALSPVTCGSEKNSTKSDWIKHQFRKSTIYIHA